MDPFDLQRFVDAQAPVFDRALAELRAGRKRTHWMWFIFPQLRGLGRSALAQRFGIAAIDEARAYLADPLLGERIALCTECVLARGDVSLEALFGAPDDRKYHSSITLFALTAAQADNVFRRALDHDFAGRLDPQTLALLA
jgi:uncharacterized protein (DUF1810 family)